VDSMIYREVTPDEREDGKCGGCGYRGDIVLAWEENDETFLLCRSCSGQCENIVRLKHG
jgi:hypothetical protein